MKENLSNKDKMVKLFENVSRTSMDKFKQYLESKQVLNENPQIEPAIAPTRPEPAVLPSPAPATPTTKPDKKPNPFAPTIQPDVPPKGVAEEQNQQEKPIDILAKKLSDEIAATYNKAKSSGENSPQTTPQ